MGLRKNRWTPENHQTPSWPRVFNPQSNEVTGPPGWPTAVTFWEISSTDYVRLKKPWKSDITCPSSSH